MGACLPLGHSNRSAPCVAARPTRPRPKSNAVRALDDSVAVGAIAAPVRNLGFIVWKMEKSEIKKNRKLP